MPRHYLIHCRDCGVPRRTTAKNTKLCTTCRFLNDAAFWQTSTKVRECAGCRKERFLPFHSDHKLCHRCSYTHPRHRGACSLCHTDDAHLIRDHRICYRCAQDPAQRAWFLKGLEKRHDRRLARFGQHRTKDAVPFTASHEPLLQEAADA